MLAKCARWYYLIFVLFPLICSSCAVFILPIPHMTTDAASIEGHITQYGAPVADRTVTYSWGCTEAECYRTMQTTTTSEGYYSFPPTRSFHLLAIVAPGADYGYCYHLAIQEGEMESPLSGGLLMAPRSGGPEHLIVNCELDDQGETCCEILDTRRKSHSRKKCIDREN